MAERLLYLVRHAEVVLRGDVHPSEWALSPQGTSDARDLGRAREWQSLAAVVASPETKTRQTAEPIAETAGVELRLEEDLREVERGLSGLVSSEEYPALVEAHFGSPEESVSGWERGTDARARVSAAIDALVEDTSGNLCVVSHGMVLSHYLAHLRDLETPPVEELRAIPLPAVAVVDPAERRLVRPFVSGRQFIGLA